MLTPNFTVDYHEEKITEKITQALRNRIQNGLAVSGQIVKDAAKQIAPKHVGDYIQVTPVQQVNENTYKVTVYVSIANAPDAGAWEYGSGLHRTRGNADKYVIEGHPLLAFDWERANIHFIGHLVHHPGIVARPYLHPALFNNISRIKAELSKK